MYYTSEPSGAKRLRTKRQRARAGGAAQSIETQRMLLNRLYIYIYIYKDVQEPDWTGFYTDFSNRNRSFGPDRIFVLNRTGSEWTGFYFGLDRT